VTDYEEGVRALEAELAAASKAGDLRRVAELHGSLGTNLDAIGDRARGIESLDELGAIHGSLADDAPALAFTRRALAMYEEDEDQPAIARLQDRLARLERKPSSN
jgi:hypothetical protein